jgi:tetratricopeptide (TPR) repeat protein
LGPNNKPIPNVIIVIESSTGIPIGQTVTNNEGDFAFSNLSESTYIVTVKEPDYLPASENVNFGTEAGGDRPGESVYVSVQLRPKPGVRTSGGGSILFVQDVPATARAAYEKGEVAARGNQSDQAITLLREAIAAFPNYFDAHLALGTELVKKGQLADAVVELDKARAINPKDDRVYSIFGMVLAREKKFSVAAAAFGEAARLNPSDPQYPLLRATVLIDDASALDPSSKNASTVRAKLFEAAKTDLDRAYEVSGKTLAAVFLQRARMAERQGDRAGAAAALEAYLKQVPNAPNAATIRESIQKLKQSN